ncbi:hypothetical protein BDZ94DRAFT_1308514 [Collybia nuda]|uniref:Uncharacterized protein n=1 Tax=Collybia nuda TaxID=64659 RepID=A0A9P6CKI4_9AGAR|nr:hypothetical protein BDZ94DRAFT_1308514 [Collybia nuda]
MSVTVDDSSPDPRTGKSIAYSPASAWNSATVCQKGPGKCTAAPNKDTLNEGTWHESTFNPVDNSSNDFPNTPLTATVQFDGTAVYVYCVLALTTSGPSGNSDMTFVIDNKVVGNFVKPAPNSPGYQYNALVYSNELLPPGPHELRIVNGRINGTKSLIIIDRIVYTFETDPTPSPPTNPSPPPDHSTQLTTSSKVTPSLSISSTHPASSNSSSPWPSVSPQGPPNSPTPPNTPHPPSPTDQPSQPQTGVTDNRKNQTSPGMIVGAVLGSLAGALFIVTALMFGRRWWQKRPHPVVPTLLPRSPPPYPSASTFYDQEPLSVHELIPPGQYHSSAVYGTTLNDRLQPVYR